APGVRHQAAFGGESAVARYRRQAVPKRQLDPRLARPGGLHHHRTGTGPRHSNKGAFELVRRPDIDGQDVDAQAASRLIDLPQERLTEWIGWIRQRANSATAQTQ